MPYNFVADGFTQKKLCSRLSSSKCDFTRNTAVLRFWAPFGGLAVTYDFHLRLIGKRVVDFLIVLFERFCWVLPLRRYERISTENRSNGSSLNQNFR